MKRFLAVLSLLSAGIGIVLISLLFSERALTQNQPSNSSPMFDGRPLTSALEQQVGQAAIGFTLANSDEFKVLSGRPQVVFTRPITAAELPATGLGEINTIGEEPPMMLVVVKGNFDTTNFGPSLGSEGSPPRTKSKYIAYVFDLRAGIPMFTATGLTGEYFRRTLRDSSLPDEPKELIGPEPGQPEAIPAPVERRAKKLPYGTEIRGEPTKESQNPPQ